MQEGEWKSERARNLDYTWKFRESTCPVSGERDDDEGNPGNKTQGKETLFIYLTKPVIPVGNSLNLLRRPSIVLSLKFKCLKLFFFPFASSCHELHHEEGNNEEDCSMNIKLFKVIS